MNQYEIPIGLGMALAQRPEAMEKFAALRDEKKQEIINGTHFISSKEQMHQYVEKIMSEY